MASDRGFSHDRPEERGTGSREIPENYKIIVYPFDRYLITIKLSPNNEFIGIMEVKVNKDFISHKEKTPSRYSNDIEEFYRQE